MHISLLGILQLNLHTPAVSIILRDNWYETFLWPDALSRANQGITGSHSCFTHYQQLVPE